ncbi:MAG TPA: hypothetical protein VJT68_03110 [Thermoleophilaceae bacterium]|nr:hypothetical protein [Thermoleophilaceae bacterium]
MAAVIHRGHGRSGGTRHPLAAAVVAGECLCGALAATGVATASGNLSVGDVLPGGDHPQPPEYRQADETVLATGNNPRVGHWRITSYQSVELRDAGEVVQPAGLPCLNLLLSDASDGRPVAGRGLCGDRGRGGLNAAVLAVNDHDGETWDVLFGHAAENSERVELRTGDLVDAARVEDGPREVRGDVWILFASHRARSGRSFIVMSGPDGVATGEPVDVTRPLDRPGDPVPIG